MGQPFVQQGSFGVAYTTWEPTTFAPMVQPNAAFAVQQGLGQGGYMNAVAEMGSHSNPYNKLNLGTGKLIGRSAGKNMGAKQLMMGEKHVVHNDLKVLENHEADKTIFTKKVIHHSPVLHKTIRTHEIAEDAVHEKLVHHMNTVKDQFKKVPGQNYIGGEQHVDHTEAIAPAPQIACASRRATHLWPLRPPPEPTPPLSVCGEQLGNWICHYPPIHPPRARHSDLHPPIT